jgi:hypothetical protein
LLTALSVVMVVNGDRQEAEHKGEVRESHQTLSTLLDQNRWLQQEVSDTKESCVLAAKLSNPAAVKLPKISAGITTSGVIPDIDGQGAANNPTVDDHPRLPRYLLDNKKNDLIECLKKKPGRFSIAVEANNSEAYKYAEDWRSVFLAAGWEIEHKDIPIQILSGGNWAGMTFKFHARSEGSGILAGTPEGNAWECLLNMDGIPGGANLMAYPNFPTGSVRIVISHAPRKK